MINADAGHAYLRTQLLPDKLMRPMRRICIALEESRSLDEGATAVAGQLMLLHREWVGSSYLIQLRLWLKGRTWVVVAIGLSILAIAVLLQGSGQISREFYGLVLSGFLGVNITIWTLQIAGLESSNRVPQLMRYKVGAVASTLVSAAIWGAISGMGAAFLTSLIFFFYFLMMEDTVLHALSNYQKQERYWEKFTGEVRLLLLELVDRNQGEAQALVDEINWRMPKPLL